MCYRLLCTFFIIVMPIICPVLVIAENIDPDNNDTQYAWCENVGWINAEPFGDSGPGMDVGDADVTGYLWGENIGWISLSCLNTGNCGTVNYGVDNDGAGNLSGYAWGENVGWISFSCENKGTCGTVNYSVQVDASGVFSGYAWGENIGWCNFAPTNGGVKTSWTPLCDIDADGDIDRNDVRQILLNRNQPASGPDDPMDADGDGQITARDAKICISQCTNPRCADSNGT